MSKVWRIVFVLVLFAKHKLRVFPHLIPRPLLLPREEKGSYDFMGFAVFFASLREPCDPLARPLRAMLQNPSTLLPCPDDTIRHNLLRS